MRPDSHHLHSLHIMYNFNVEKMSKRKAVYNNFYILFIDLLNTVACQQSELQQGYQIMQKYRDETLANEKLAFDKQKQQNEMIEKLNFEIIKLKASLLQVDQLIQYTLQPKIEEVVNENVRIRLENKNIDIIKAERDRFRSELESFNKTNRININYLENKNMELEQNITEKIKLLKEMSETVTQLKATKQHPEPKQRTSANMSARFSATDETFITLTEHNYRIKTFERAQSGLVAENMGLNDLKVKYESDILNLRASLEECNARIQELVYKFEETHSECEVYKIQAMTYREDFEEERRMRERLANEIDNWKNPK